MFKQLLISIFLLFHLSTTSLAQKTLKLEKIKPVDPYPTIRKADVLWQKRIWREIDLKEKTNHHFITSMEGLNLFDILIKEISTGYLTAYSTIDDRFSKELSKEEVKAILMDSSFVYAMDEKGSPTTRKKVPHSTSSSDIIKYWLKEDWFFNTRTSEIETRILGICPIRIKQSNSGNTSGVQQLFWVYFPHARTILHQYDALVIEKDTINYDVEEHTLDTNTYDHVFRKRMFSSYVINKSNAREQSTSNKTSVEIFLENQRTRRYIFNQEHDMWSY